jgi:hypothetical protein
MPPVGKVKSKAVLTLFVLKLGNESAPLVFEVGGLLAPDGDGALPVGFTGSWEDGGYVYGVRPE